MLAAIGRHLSGPVTVAGVMLVIVSIVAEPSAPAVICAGCGVILLLLNLSHACTLAQRERR